MRSIAWTLPLIALFATPPAAAQPMDTYGMGSRSVALGGAVGADVEDFSANYYNAAGVVRDRQLTLGVGWFGVGHDLSMNDLPSNVDPVHGIVVGLNIPGSIGDFRFAFGLALHLNDQRVSRTRVLPRTEPRWELYDNRPHRTFLATNLAIEPLPWLRIGGGIGFLSDSEVDLRIRGEVDIVSAERGSALEHDALANLVTIRFPLAGIQIQPTEWLNFGIVYRGEYAVTSEVAGEIGTEELSGPDSVDLVAGDLSVPAYLALSTASTSAYVPHQLSFSASVNPVPELRIGVEVTWLLWHLYQSPLGRTDLDVRIEVPPELAGTITIPPLMNSSPVPAEFSDRVVPRLGVEWSPLSNPDLGVDVRAGYFYENSPAPQQSGRFNLVDTDRHAWSLGAGLELRSLRPTLPGQLRFDLHLQYAFLPARRMSKRSPIDPTGDYVAQGHIYAGGLTIGARFE